MFSSKPKPSSNSSPVSSAKTACPFVLGDFVVDKAGTSSGEVVALYEEIVKSKSKVVIVSKQESHWWVAYCGLDTVLTTRPNGAPTVASNVKWNRCESLDKVPSVPNNFPLAQLPEPFLVNLFELLPLYIASKQSYVNKKFSDAFRNNVHWKNRCLLDIDPQDCGGCLQEEFTRQKLDSWMEFYRLNGVWKISLVTIFGHRGGASLSGEVHVVVPASCTVRQLKEKLVRHPDNRQGEQSYQPFDPSKMIFRYQPPNYTPIYGDPDKKANCKYSEANLDLTLRQVGLTRGAILCQRETMMCD